MTRAELRIDGAPELARGLARVAGELGDLSEPGRESSERVAAHARVTAPRDTGFLASTIRAAAYPDVSVVNVDAPYAPFVHWGVPSRNMAARPFLTTALEADTAATLDTYTDHVNHLLARVEGI